MHVVISTLNSGRGSGTGVVQNARALVDAGHEVTLVSTMQPPRHLQLPDEVLFVKVNLEGKSIPVHESLYTQDGSTVIASRINNPELVDHYVADYTRALRRPMESADLVVAHHANLNTVAAAELTEGMGIPLITRVHGTCVRGYEENGAIQAYQAGDFEGNGYTWGKIRAALNSSSRIVPISNFVNVELVRPHLDLQTQNKVSVIPNFIDPDMFDYVDGNALKSLVEAGKIPLDGEGNPKKGILYLGPMTEIKGAKLVAGMADYFEGENLDDVPIYLIGQGEGEMLAEGRPNVHYLGTPSDMEKTAAFRHLGILGVTPNLLIGEDFGRVHKELALAGVPTIAPASGVYPEHIEDNITGFLIPPEHQQPQYLAKEVRQCLGLGEERLRWVGYNARRSVLDNFGRDKTIDRFVSTVEGVQRGIGEGHSPYARR